MLSPHPSFCGHSPGSAPRGAAGSRASHLVLQNPGAGRGFGLQPHFLNLMELFLKLLGKAACTVENRHSRPHGNLQGPRVPHPGPGGGCRPQADQLCPARCGREAARKLLLFAILTPTTGFSQHDATKAKHRNELVAEAVTSFHNPGF